MDVNSQKSEVTSKRSEVKSERSELDFQLSALNSAPSIELHIEELVLHGFPSSDRYAIGDAVGRELARLFRKQGVPNLLRSESTMDEIKGATFNPTPHAVGRQIAQAVYKGFGQ